MEFPRQAEIGIVNSTAVPAPAFCQRRGEKISAKLTQDTLCNCAPLVARAIVRDLSDPTV